jgi:hypothetical protein
MFSAFSAKVEPAEYVRRIDAVLNRHYALGRIRMLAVARNTATRLSAKPCQNRRCPDPRADLVGWIPKGRSRSLRERRVTVGRWAGANLHKFRNILRNSHQNSHSRAKKKTAFGGGL